jgi:hypothetical protein
MKKVTGQGIEKAEASVMIDLRIKPVAAAAKARQAAQKETCYAESNEMDALHETSFRLVFCIICGRSAGVPAAMAQSP